MELQSDVDRFFSSDIHPHHSVNTSIIRLNVTFPSGLREAESYSSHASLLTCICLPLTTTGSAGGRDAKLKPKSFRYFCCFVSPRFFPANTYKNIRKKFDQTSLTCNEHFFSISTFSKRAVLNLRAGRFWPTRHMFDYISLYLMG